MLVHAKMIWLIRTFLLRNQRHWSHLLCWSMQRLHWSEDLFWKIRGTTHPLCWSMQRWFDWSKLPPEKSEALDSPPMLVHAKVIWVIRTSLHDIRGTGLTSYVGPCKGDLSDQNISPEKSEALDSPPMLVHAKVIWLIRKFLLRNQRPWTHLLCWCMKGDLSDQNIPPKKSEVMDSPTMLVHAKVIWLIRTSLLRNQRHWSHCLWSMQRWFDWSKLPSWEIRKWTHLLHWN